jgi:hypothetical protein
VPPELAGDIIQELNHGAKESRDQDPSRPNMADGEK